MMMMFTMRCTELSVDIDFANKCKLCIEAGLKSVAHI